MKLIASLTSPYARKVRIVLAEKKIDCPLQLDIPWESTSTVADFNPLGKVPVLLMDDGSSLYDSRVIVEYLDTISPVSRLLPQDKRQLIETRRFEALADGICDAAANIVMESRRPAAQQSQEWVDRQHGKVTRGLAAHYRPCWASATGAMAKATAWPISPPAACWAIWTSAFRSWHGATATPIWNALADKLAVLPSFADTCAT